MILDRRAAAYEKLNKLESALHDGKYMMKKDKSHPAVSFDSGAHLLHSLTPLGLPAIWKSTTNNAETSYCAKYLRIWSP